MKIAVVSDVHNNEVNLQKVLTYCEKNKIKKIICCGDLASEDTLDFFCDNFSGEILYTFGNMDNEQLRNFEHVDQYKNADIFEKFGEAEIDGKKVAFVHFPDVAKKLCDTKKYDFVFYGHTHKPWEETQENCKMLNPGNTAGEIYPPTFAVWETSSDEFELIRIHDLS
ncbi:MAG: YfcE family phosphodiesterase [Candidatus Moranbacteria bacterium]|nr:YfcE family phosphodiesterase [Candidatus Moranbacteria bacterium]